MRTKKTYPTDVIGTLVVFVGFSPDHHKVLCIQRDGRLSPPTANVPEGTHPDDVLFDLRDTLIKDDDPHRPSEDACYKLRLPRGIVRVFAHAEIIDSQCWMKCAHTGIWVPRAHLLDPESQSAEIYEALTVLSHRHWHEEALTDLKREYHEALKHEHHLG